MKANTDTFDVRNPHTWKAVVYTSEAGDKFTYFDILVLCLEWYRDNKFTGDAGKAAQLLVNNLTWQHPSTLLNEALLDGEIKDYPDAWGIGLTPEEVLVEELPSTTNAWGFAGSYDIKRYFMSNGDIWATGTAGYRHAKPSKWVHLTNPLHIDDKRIGGEQYEIWATYKGSWVWSLINKIGTIAYRKKFYNKLNS